MTNVYNDKNNFSRGHKDWKCSVLFIVSYCIHNRKVRCFWGSISYPPHCSRRHCIPKSKNRKLLSLKRFSTGCRSTYIAFKAIWMPILVQSAQSGSRWFSNTWSDWVLASITTRSEFPERFQIRKVVKKSWRLSQVFLWLLQLLNSWLWDQKSSGSWLTCISSNAKNSLVDRNFAAKVAWVTFYFLRNGKNSKTGIFWLNDYKFFYALLKSRFMIENF